MKTKTVAVIAKYAFLTLTTLVILLPVIWMLSTSFKTPDGTFAYPPEWIPRPFTFQSYHSIFAFHQLGQYFRNSLIVVILSTVLSVVVSTLTGYGVTRFNFPGRKSFVGFLLVSQMFPAVMMVIPYFELLRTYGLVNTYTGLILAYTTFQIPLCSWMMIGYFRSVPRELDEAAAIDGCSSWRTFRKVVLPLVTPGLAATGIYAFLQGWNQFLFPLVLVTTDDLLLLPVALGRMVGEYRIAWNDLMAASVMASLPLVICYLILQRFFVSSLTAGAVKQ